MVTMSQKSSVLQPDKSVSQALTPDRDADSRAAGETRLNRLTDGQIRDDDRRL
jgi:hypothetical protein